LTPEERIKSQGIASELIAELESATKKFGPFCSEHHGQNVIREELDELWDEIKDKHGTKAKQRLEAIQVGAMAIRYIMDVCDD
jgi:hypothetical protein